MLPKNSENGNQPAKMVSKMPTKGKKSPKFGVTVLHPKCFPAANAPISLVHRAVKHWNILPLRPELTTSQFSMAILGDPSYLSVVTFQDVQECEKS
jgi:hypothetical protein